MFIRVIVYSFNVFDVCAKINVEEINIELSYSDNNLDRQLKFLIRKMVQVLQHMQ